MIIIAKEPGRLPSITDQQVSSEVQVSGPIPVQVGSGEGISTTSGGEWVSIAQGGTLSPTLEPGQLQKLAATANL